MLDVSRSPASLDCLWSSYGTLVPFSDRNTFHMAVLSCMAMALPDEKSRNQMGKLGTARTVRFVS